MFVIQIEVEKHLAVTKFWNVFYTVRVQLGNTIKPYENSALEYYTVLLSSLWTYITCYAYM